MEEFQNLDIESLVSDQIEKVRISSIRPSEKNAGIYDPPSECLCYL